MTNTAFCLIRRFTHKVPQWLLKHYFFYQATPSEHCFFVCFFCFFTKYLLLSRFSRVLLLRPHRRQPTRLPRPWDSPGKNTGVGCHVLLQCMKVKSEREVTQSCPTLSDPMDCSLPGSFVHGIFQARVLEWVAIAFSTKYLDVFNCATFFHFTFISLIFYNSPLVWLI